MRVWRNIDGKLVDAGTPQAIGDLVFLHSPMDVPAAVQHLVGPAPDNADYFVVDASGPHYEKEMCISRLRINLGTNIEAGPLQTKNLFPNSGW